MNKIEKIQEERQEDYGDAKESFDSIASYWSNYLSRSNKMHVKIDATDVAFMMTLFKVSRNSYKRKLDNAIDCASYADFGLQLMKKKN